MPAASGHAGQPALLEPLPGRWAQRSHRSPGVLPSRSTALHQLLRTDAAGGPRASVLLGEHWQDQQQGNRGGLGRLSHVKSWAGWGGGGNVTARRQTREVQLQGSLLRDWEKAGSSLRARGDVFSSLKFDFHDLFCCWLPLPQCHSQHWVRLCFPC